jgi:hypothetical protein
MLNCLEKRLKCCSIFVGSVGPCRVRCIRFDLNWILLTLSNCLRTENEWKSTGVFCWSLALAILSSTVGLIELIVLGMVKI